MEQDDYDGVEWNEDKSESTYQERGFDFAFAAEIVEDIFLNREDQRKDHGETRYIASRHVQEFYITVFLDTSGTQPSHHSRRLENQEDKKATVRCLS